MLSLSCFVISLSGGERREESDNNECIKVTLTVTASGNLSSTSCCDEKSTKLFVMPSLCRQLYFEISLIAHTACSVFNILF